MCRNFFGLKLLLLSCLLIISTCEKESTNPEDEGKGSATDIEGNVFKTVKIGNQVWMAENLKVTHFRNGDSIPQVTDDSQWYDLLSSAYCDYDNDSSKVEVYGRLYNWYAVNDRRRLAPQGWHIPSNAEWQTLINYLGGDEVAGGKIKETGTEYWTAPNTGATNESGFTALPGGFRDAYGNFNSMGGSAWFWTAMESSDNAAWYWMLSNSQANAVNDPYSKRSAYAVRCIKD
jgi:uncharacterized protein (TIGR02145 family)